MLQSISGLKPVPDLYLFKSEVNLNTSQENKSLPKKLHRQLLIEEIFPKLGK